MTAGQAKKLVVGGVALHSIILGAAMLIRPMLVLELSGWQYDGDAFFPQQAGIFLTLLGGAYAMALWHRHFAWFLVVSKTVAVAFLVGEHLFGTAPKVILVAALLDGLMGAAVAITMIWDAMSQRNRPAREG